MIKLSRRKRWLNRTPRTPKMSTRRQFHRALRRHPAWPAVMAEAAARAQLHKQEAAARARAQESIRRSVGIMEMASASHRKRLRRILNRNRTNVMVMGQASGRIGFRRAVRRNRAGAIALAAAGALVALLTGLAVATGDWRMRTLSAPGSPAARFGAASTFDMNHNAMLIFGGFPDTPPSSVGSFGRVPLTAIGDTWTFSGYGNLDDTTWTNRTAVNNPSPRGFASMVYDEARHNTVLFGGALKDSGRSNNGDGPVYDDTWIWDGSDWTLVNPPEPRPEARQNASMFYDAHRKVVVMFGGHGVGPTGVGTALNDTWTWDGSRWKIMSSTGAPSPRHSAAVAYDVCRAQAVMFGGVPTPAPELGTPVPEPAETWTWNGTSWKQEHPPATPLLSPSPRMGASMTYSPYAGRVLLYGGLSVSDTGSPTAAIDPDFWMWDGAGWEKANSDTYITPAFDSGEGGEGPGTILPPPRAYASFVYDHSPRKFAHLFGGTPAGASPHPVLPDQWWLLSQGDVVNSGGAGSDPRKCENPVPVPPDEAPTGGVQNDDDQAPEAAALEGIREIGQLPVLLGTDWPINNRNPKIGSGSSATPNPNYTPPPDCPNFREGETGARTHLTTDPKRNRVYQFFICDPDRPSQQPNTVPKLLVQAYDGTTLKPLGSVILPIDVTPAGYQTFLGDQLLHDANGGRFFIASGGSFDRNLWEIQQDLIEKSRGSLLAPSQFPKITLSGTVLRMSLFNHPTTGRPKLLLNRGTSLSQLDLASNSVDWNGAVTGCTNMGFDPYSFNPRPMRSGNRVYNSCITDNRTGIVRIPVDKDPNDPAKEVAGTPEVFPGPFGVVNTWGDPQSERILALSDTRGGGTLYVFDGKTSRFVGRITITSEGFSFGLNTTHRGFGFDQGTGRLYVQLSDDQGYNNVGTYQVQGGLLVADTRLIPVPQAANFTQYASIAGSPIATLPLEPGAPRRVFIRRMGGTMKKYPDGETVKMPNEMFYRVLADEVPVPKPPDIAELDALTIPVAERAGKTEVSFDAEASAYGIRLRSVGGILSAVRPFASFQGNWEPAEVLLYSGVLTPYTPTCVFPDRELIAGWVPQARLSELDAAAQARGLEVDSNSKTDLQGPFSRCSPPVGPADLPLTTKPVTEALWPLLQLAQQQGDSAVGPNLTWSNFFNEVECVGDASNATQTVGADVSGSASCNQKQGRVVGTSRGALGPAAANANAGFSVGEGYSNVVVAKDAVKGVVATSTAEARDIKLSNLTIGYIKTEAVVWSNGRPGGKRATFTRKICGVSFPGAENPDNPQGCLTPQQQQEMVTRWNSGWGVNSKMTLPAYDSELFNGSPGGYIAGVIKPAADETEDQLFAKDFQREVSGLVIEFYKDSQVGGPARQVLQLAAVRAVSGYGVQCLSELIYSPSAKDCVALPEDAFGNEPEEVFEDEGELLSLDDTELELDGGWVPVVSIPEGLALGKKIGRLLDTLPIVRMLPIRAMGEALLAWSVWFLLALPLLFAWRRLTLDLGPRP